MVIGEQERLAYRMLGRFAEAADAVAQARRKTGGEAQSGWFGTVVARVSLNMLRARPKGVFEMPDPVVGAREEPGDVGLGVLVALDALTPDERLAYVLHDMFEEPFEQVAPLIGRTALGASQVEARARRRIEDRPAADTGLAAQAEVVRAFLDGEDVLDAAVTLRSEGIWLRGAESVAPRVQPMRAPCTRPAVVGGEAGLVSVVDGTPVLLAAFTVRDQKIVAINAITDRAHVRALFSPE